MPGYWRADGSYSDGSSDVQLTGSNVEQTIGSAIPSKAVLMGISDGSNIRALLGNTQGTLLASSARTATTVSPDITNYNARGVIVFLDVTAASGTGGLVVTIRGRDQLSGKAFILTTSPTAVISTGQTALELYPGASGTGIYQRTSGSLPRTFYVAVSHGDSSSYTYSLGYALII